MRSTAWSTTKCARARRNEVLRKFYESHGFATTGTMEFNPDVAPDDWDENPHLRDQPDVMFMAQEPDGFVEATQYDGSEWAEAKDDAQRAANS